jgi:hypothetical protein
MRGERMRLRVALRRGKLQLNPIEAPCEKSLQTSPNLSGRETESNRSASP